MSIPLKQILKSFKLLEENIIINSLRKQHITIQQSCLSQERKSKFTWNTHRDGSGKEL